MTLIEIIVVITILSLLMAAVGVAVIPQLDEAKVDRAKMDIQNIQNALKTYYAKKGNYPDTGAGLKALVDAQILEKMPVDPWDHEYRLRARERQAGGHLVRQGRHPRRHRRRRRHLTRRTSAPPKK